MNTGEPLGRTIYDTDFKDIDLGAGAKVVKKEVTPSLEGIFDGNSEDALTEYATKFNVKEMIEKVVHAHKEAKASLEGVLNYGEQSSMATEYDASFVAKAVTEVTAPNATEPEADASNVDTTAAQQIEEASRTTTELASETPTTEAEADQARDGHEWR